MKKAIYDVRVSDKRLSNGFYQWIIFKNNAFLAQGRNENEAMARLEASYAIKDDLASV